MGPRGDANWSGVDMSPVHQVCLKPSRKTQWKGEEDKSDRKRGGKTTWGNGQAWSWPSPRGQWRTEKWRKLVVKSFVLPQRPLQLRDRWRWRKGPCGWWASSVGTTVIAQERCQQSFTYQLPWLPSFRGQQSFTYVILIVKLQRSAILYIPVSLIAKLQRVQNWAAHFVVHASPHVHIIPVLRHLHWLPVRAQISYKMACLSFRAITSSTPA